MTTYFARHGQTLATLVGKTNGQRLQAQGTQGTQTSARTLPEPLYG